MALLPDPTPRERQHILISVDDHLIEPPDMFEGRIPARAGRPRTEDRRVRRRHARCGVTRTAATRNIGLNAVIGRPKEEWSMEAARFDEMRRGCWDIDARIADMDLAGIWASLNFPSLIAGFAGTVFCEEQRPRARPRVRCGRGTTGTSKSGPAATPTASSRCSCRGSRDPELAADERAPQRRARVQGRELPREPAHLGLPSVHTGHWDPLLRRVRGDRHRHLPPHRIVAQWAADPRSPTPRSRPSPRCSR